MHVESLECQAMELFHKCWKTQALFMENQFGGRWKADWRVRSSRRQEAQSVLLQARGGNDAGLNPSSGSQERDRPNKLKGCA